MGPVDQYQRMPPDDLEAAGYAHRGQTLLHDVLVEWFAEERLDGG